MEVNTCGKDVNIARKKELALKVIRKEKPVSHIANENNVSRQFLYKQKAKAISAIDQAFEKKEEEEKVLFYLPVTKAWLRQVVLILLLHCCSSFRGVIKALKDMLDINISIGTVYNIAQEATSKAYEYNANQDLSNVRHGTNDEVFHGSRPVLTGVDISSLYCYLLSEEDQRDADTWAIHLLDLVKQGFDPDYTIADYAKGLREGQKIACPNIPCHGDTFHIIQMLQELRRYFTNRLKSRISYLADIEGKMKRAKIKGTTQKFSVKLSIARKEKEKYQELSNSINILVSWMQHDVLKIAGPDPKTRRELYNFIVDEIKKLELIHPHRIKTVRITLENQRDNVLAFVDVLNSKFEFISQRYDVPLYLLWELCELQRYSQIGSAYYQRERRLRQILKHQFYYLQNEVIEAMKNTPKASSAVENLHSRLSSYFTLRKHIGNKYLDLLRFYLNHTPFLRSENPERVGKTATEVLNRKEHPHWLEMLGFKDIQAAA